MAVVLVSIYLLMNLVVILSGLNYLTEHPENFQAWLDNVSAGEWHFERPFNTGTGAGSILLACLLLFPKLALGLSGFETGVAVMPLIKGKGDDTFEQPAGRIRNTRKLLVTAAL